MIDPRSNDSTPHENSKSADILFRLVEEGDVDGALGHVRAESGVIHQRDAQGRTALHVAAMLGDYEMVALLIEQGANDRLADLRGRVPRDVLGLRGELEAEHGIANWIDEWPPQAAWACFRRRRRLTALALFALCSALLVVVHPRFNGPLAWNSVDAVEAIPSRPRSATTAAAGSGEHLLLKRQSGDSEMLHLPSRVARPVALSGDIVDVSAAERSGQFLLLRRHAIDRVHANLSVEPWLAPAKSPDSSYWPQPAGSPARPEVLACELEPSGDGLTLCLKNVGASRYQMLGEVRARRRSFLVTPATTQPVVRALFTDRRVWTAVSDLSRQGGGSVLVRALQRDTMLPECDCALDGIRSIDADRGDGWAAAIDGRGSLHLCTPADGRWRQGVFGEQAEGAPRLQSLRDVRHARLSGHVAYLAARGAAYCYDTASRRIECVVDTRIDHILPIASDRSDESRALLLGNGVYHVAATAGEEIEVACLDAGRVEAADGSPDGRLAVYISRSGQEAPRLSVCRGGDGAAPLVQVLIPGGGWRKLAAPPQVRGMAAFGSKWIFGTAQQGAFVYDPKTHQYADCSTAHDFPERGAPPRRSPAVPVTRFSSVQRIEDSVVAIVDKRPVRFNPVTQQPGWQFLLPPDAAPCTQVTVCDDTPIAMDDAGQLIRISRPLGPGQTSIACTGSWAGVGDDHLRGAAVIGDLLVRSEQDWQLAILQGRSLCGYSSVEARMDKKELAWLADSRQPPRQLRLTRDAVLFTLPDGTIRSSDGGELFQAATFDFRPTDATAVAGVPGGEEILLAGPAGQVVRYRWSHASCQVIGGGPVPLAGPSDRVVELAAAPQGYFARLRSGRIASSDGTRWTVSGDYHHWAIDRSRDNWWLAGPGGVTCVSVTRDASPSQRKRPPRRIHTGQGMQTFVAGADYAWQRSPERIGILRDDRVGTYDARTASWQEIEVAGLGTARAYAADASGGLVLARNDHVVRLDAELKLTRLSALPPAPGPVSLHCDGNRLTLACAAGGELCVETWADARERDSAAVRRRGGAFPSGFDARQVIFADHLDDTVLLVDHRGAAVIYDAQTGKSSRLWSAGPADRLSRWAGSLRQHNLTLFVDAAGQGTRTAMLAVDGAQARAHERPAGDLQLALAEASRRLAADARLPMVGGLLNAMSTELRRYSRTLEQSLQYVENAPRKYHVGPIVVTRSSEGTTYARGDHALPLCEGGFRDDIFADVAALDQGLVVLLGDHRTLAFVPLPPDGALDFQKVVAQSEHLIERLEKLGPEHVRVHYDGAPSENYQLTVDGQIRPTVSNHTQCRASLSYSSLRLEVERSDGGPIRFAWRTGDRADAALPPVWQDGRLAVQVVKSLAVWNDRLLLLGTSAGVVARDLASDLPISFFPEIPTAELFHDVNHNELIARSDRGKFFRWEESRFKPHAVRDDVVLTCAIDIGPWTWSIEHRASDSPQVSIHDGSQSLRTARLLTNGSWQFTDDFVNWIGRDPNDGSLWLATGNGLWAFDCNRGRVAQQPMLPGQDVREVQLGKESCWWKAADNRWAEVTRAGQAVRSRVESPRPAESAIDNAAISIRSAGGRVRFVPFDGADREILSRGRFFFDQSGAIVSRQGTLYTFVPGRCLLARNSQQLGVVTGAWKLPGELAADADVELSADDVGLHLIASSADGTPEKSWSIDPKATNEWSRVPDPAFPGTRIGPVVWGRPRREADFQPRVAESRRLSAQALTSDDLGDRWWHDDRFAWDCPLQIGVLTDEFLLGTTPNGLAVWRLGDDDAMLWAYAPLRRQARIHAVYDARGIRRGLVLSLSDRSIVYPVNAGAQASLPAIEPKRVNGEILRRGVLDFVLVSPPGGGSSYVGLRESWVTDRARAALAWEVSGLPAPEPLLPHGQLVFDAAQGASRLRGHSGDRWVCYQQVNLAEGPRTLLTLNEFAPIGRSDRTSFRLLGAWFTDVSLQSLRCGDSHDLIAAWPATGGRAVGAWRLRSTTLPGGASQAPLVWMDADSEKSRSLFRVGSNVTLDVARLRFSEVPRYAWEHRPPFSTSPGGFDPWSKLPGGLAFSFDVFQSMTCYDPPPVGADIQQAPTADSRSRLAISTAGGVLIAPFRERLTADEIVSGEGVAFYPHLIAAGAAAPARANRIRALEGGALQVALNEGRFATLANGRWSDSQALSSLAMEWARSGGEGDEDRPRSNDAWWYGRRDVDGIVDAYRDVSTAATWLCTARQGVFRVVHGRTSAHLVSFAAVFALIAACLVFWPVRRRDAY
jgi:hypothetical protein